MSDQPQSASDPVPERVEPVADEAVAGAPEPGNETELTVTRSDAGPDQPEAEGHAAATPQQAEAEQSAVDETAVAHEPPIEVAEPVEAGGVIEVVGDVEVDEEEEEEEEFVGPVEPIELIEEPEEEEETEKDWYILKVQSNREASIRDGLQRRVAVAGLERFFDEIIVPTEDVAEFKNGKKRIVKRKLYPGYIVVHMAINDDTWFLVRETPGIGDFTGSAGRPTPMLSHEVERIVKSARTEDDGGEPIKTAIPFKIGERVRIKEGTFENFEGDVEEIDEANGRVTVIINIFGRSTPVELEHWQIESV